jgi:hypothetical protein
METTVFVSPVCDDTDHPPEVAGLSDTSHGVVFGVFPGCTVQVPDSVTATEAFCILTLSAFDVEFSAVPDPSVSPTFAIPLAAVATAFPATWLRFTEAFDGGEVVTVPETVTVLLTDVRRLPDVSSESGLVCAVA